MVVVLVVMRVLCILFKSLLLSYYQPPSPCRNKDMEISCESKHVQYCQSDTGRESTSRPDKLLQTVNMPYGSSLFVSAVGGWVKRR